MLSRRIQLVVTFITFILHAVITAQNEEDLPDNQQTICTKKQECRCIKLQDRSIMADCSNLQLTSVPDFIGNISIIDLSNNNLSLFYRGGEIPNSVVHLDLSNNVLHGFTDNAFQKLSNLETLNLKFNKLSYEEQVFNAKLFSNLTRLKQINLQHNMEDGTVPLHEYPVALAAVQSLTDLEIDGIQNATFHQSFKRLKNLKYLSMSGFSGNCHLVSLRKTSFNNTPFLRYLNLSGCNLHSVENGTFRSLSELQYLNISHNKRLTFRALPYITHDLQYTSIDVFDYSKIHCTYGPGTIHYVDDLKPLRNTNLTELYLDSNRVVIAEADVISNMPKTLRKASLKDNRLTMGKYAFYTFTLENLEIFEADYQYKSHIPTPDTNRFEICYDWRSPHKPLEFDIQNTRENITQEPYENLDEFISYTDRFKRDFDEWENSPFQTTIIPAPKKLKTVRFESGTLTYKVPELTFSPHNVVENIYLRGNVLYSWEGPINNLNHVVYIDLSQNFCSNMSSVFFTGFPNLQFLNISNNLLGFNFRENSKIDPFANLHNLIMLDMSTNRIHSIPSNAFRKLKNLKMLDLHSNSLIKWNFAIGHMKNLSNINLSKNQLTTIPKHVRDQIEDIAQNDNLTLNLVDNIFRCDCSENSQDFIRWVSAIQKRFKLFTNFDNLSCIAFNDTVVRFSGLDDYLAQLDRECGTHLGLIVGVIGAILFSITCVIGGIIYRYRWKLRYLFYFTKRKYFGYSVVRSHADGKMYHYDAFVSYAEEDSKFVCENMLQAIQNDRNLALCLHQRDFIAGLAVAENITNAINNSRKTIVILSPNYLKSQWCMFEFNMARMEGIYSRDGSSVLILIKYKPVLAKTLSLEMMHVMENQSYIEYPNDPNHADDVFWENVASSLVA